MRTNNVAPSNLRLEPGWQCKTIKVNSQRVTQQRQLKNSLLNCSLLHLCHLYLSRSQCEVQSCSIYVRHCTFDLFLKHVFLKWNWIPNTAKRSASFDEYLKLLSLLLWILFVPSATLLRLVALSLAVLQRLNAAIYREGGSLLSKFQSCS